MEAKQRENLIKKCEEIYTKAMQAGPLQLALDAVALQYSIEAKSGEEDLEGYINELNKGETKDARHDCKTEGQEGQGAE